MQSDFDSALTKVLRYEGGYVNDPRDPGGETNFGISKRAYPKEDIAGMTRERAAEIYRRDYWLPAHCDMVSSALRPLYFDTAVNCGVSTAIKMLQRCGHIADDGKFGPMTSLAALSVKPQAYADERLRYYDALIASKPALVRFKKGWTNRVNGYLR
jgi:lysozyme family protein